MRKKIPIIHIAAATVLVIALNAASAELASAESVTTNTKDTDSTSHLDLSSNECLKNLDNNDLVITSIAFKDGLDGSRQLKELVKRRPWGAGTANTTEEIKSQIETQSPFLIITLTKEQALTLDKHRDIIRWILVQSTSKSCE